MTSLRKQTRIWTTRRNFEIRICDMSLSHLTNSINMLENIARARYHRDFMLALDMEANTTGDMAQETARNALREMGEICWKAYLSDIYNNLILDLARRTTKIHKKHLNIYKSYQILK